MFSSHPSSSVADDSPTVQQFRERSTFTPSRNFLTSDPDMREPRATDLLVFFHAQRTAGSALRHIFIEGCGHENVYTTHTIPDYKHWPELSDEQLRPYKVFAGHSNFCEMQTDRRLLYVTLLRNPVYRAASLYFYCQRKDGHALRELANSTDMDEFYRQGSKLKPKYFRNTMCLRTCGKPSADRAIQLIESRYLAVGATENLPGFVDQLGGILGWPKIEVPRQESDHSRYINLMSEDFIEMVQRESAEDVRLWNHMCDRYFCSSDQAESTGL